MTWIALTDPVYMDMLSSTHYPYLNSHGSWVDDLDLVPVPTPHLVMYHSHAANRMMGTAKVQ